MKKSKLLAVFNALPTAELRAFPAFVRSPYFNGRADVEALADFLLKQRLARSPVYQKERVWAAIFPEKAFHDGDMRTLMSRSVKVLEAFLAWRELEKSPVRQGIFLAKGYSAIGSTDFSQTALASAKQILEAAPLRNTAFQRDRFDLEFEHFRVLGSSKRSQEIDLRPLASALDTWYFTEKLIARCGELTQQAVVKTDYEAGLTDAILAEIERQPALLDDVALRMAYTWYKAMTDADGERFFRELRALLRESQATFSPEEVRGIAVAACNFCIRRWNAAGEMRFAREGFDLYREGIELGWLVVDGQLSHFTFINAVALGLRLGEFAWAEAFIEAQREKLPPKQRHNTSVFCRARLRYEQGNHAAAQRLLVEYEPDDPYHFLISRTLLLKMYVEQNETDALDSLLEALRQYLRGKEHLGYQKTYFETVARLARQLLHLKPGDRSAAEKLREGIASLNVVSDREWFLRMLERG